MDDFPKEVGGVVMLMLYNLNLSWAESRTRTRKTNSSETRILLESRSCSVFKNANGGTVPLFVLLFYVFINCFYL